MDQFCVQLDKIYLSLYPPLLMKPRFYIFMTLAALFLLAAFLLAAQQMAKYQVVRGVFPTQSAIADVPVSGLDSQTAGARVAQLYALTPIELRYEDSVIHIDPQTAGQNLDLPKMLTEAQQAIGSKPFWEGYWAFLWNELPGPVETGLACSVDEERLAQELSELFTGRYVRPASQAQIVPGNLHFQHGLPGQEPDWRSALPEIQHALCSPTARTVTLDSKSTLPQPPSVPQLELALQALIQQMGFDGLVELYYEDLSSGQEIQLAYNKGRQIEPGVAFTAASTIKIPVMVSAYKQLDSGLSDTLRQKMAEMIDLSENTSTDSVMQMAIDQNIAPVLVTQDVRAIGLENTFLAGYFFTGAPLLDRYITPANQRGDLSTDPDIYNQTTAADMGRLLAAIEQCAAHGSGPLVQVFEGKVTQVECQEMVEFLANNRKGVLIEVGLPEGTRMAHKYGWVIDSEDGLMHTVSDAAVVYSPGGNFVLTLYLYHPTQLHWDPAQVLAARLSTLVYNFHNP